MIAEILTDKKTMKAIADYVIKEIERRDRIQKKKWDKIHEDALNSCYEERYGDND